MKDLKGLVKQARDAIKNKDFQSAMKISKCILKEDKTNYMAMIFLGLSLQEVGPVDHTPKAFQKAIDMNPSNPLGWQGLISYYEKLNTDEVKAELVKSLISYLAIETNDKKITEYCKKLCNLNNEDSTEICNVLYSASRKCPKESKVEILKLLTEFLEKSNESEEISSLYEICLADLKSASEVTENFYSSYLTMLNKNGQHIKVLEHSVQMREIFPSSTISLSWICKIFNQLYIEGNLEINKYRRTIHNYVDALLVTDSKNAMGLFTEAVLLTEDKKYLEAKENLSEVTSQRPGLVYAWILLTDVLTRLNLKEEASLSLFKSKKLIQSMNSPTAISNKVKYQELEIISISHNMEDWKKAVTIYSQKDFDCAKCLPVIISININMEQYTDAEKYISQLKLISEEQAKLCEIRVLKKQKRYSDALQLIEKCSYNFSEWWIEKGTLFWELNDFKNALEPFLKAAKCEPNNYLCFIYLGNCYTKYGQFDKSRRCYEKAIRINPSSSEAGSELSKIYRKQKNWDANLNLLTNLTHSSINIKNLWAWLQLGLTHLEQGDCVKALEYLRMVLRVDPENVHCWESLADAYFSRGAFTSALKCYQKATDLSQGSLYPALQVAYIKKILGEYSEAKVDFENILLANGQYVLALKGLGETCLCQARECLKEQRIGTARDYAQTASNKMTLAILQRSELNCLWKLLADCVLFVAKLPETFSLLNVSKTLLDTKVSEEYQVLEQEELFALAIKCYCKAVSLAEDNPFLWHDLGASYLAYACHVRDPIKKSELCNYALAAAQHCATMNPGNWQHWNLLGNVAIIMDAPNYALAQHSFIKAVTAEHNSAVAWTNLGLLYLFMDDLKLANKAFGEGQRSDPNYVNSWIGQAIIAELMGHSDAMDLFRHSTQLGQHQQGSIGYGHWVCYVLLNSLSSDKAVQYSIYNMHAIPVACDAVNWYTEKNPYNGCAWNMLGILYERMGIKNSARDAFRKAYALAGKRHKDAARINYGRLLYRTGSNKKAIEMFSEVQEATFSSGAGLALALFRDAQYKESFAAYEQALHWLTEEQTSQSDLLVALASMAYKFQGVDAAKTLLFQSIDLKPPSSWSLYSTFSLALLHDDLKLAALVLNELVSLESTSKENGKEYSEYIYHYCTLLSYFYLIKNDKNGAITGLSNLVHRHPNEASTWSTLSQLLFRLQKDRKRLAAATKCASTAMKLDQKSMDVSKVLCLAALSFYMTDDLKQASLFAQKAIHYCPDLPEGWVTLLPVLTRSKEKVLTNKFILNLQNYFSETECNGNILRWLEKHNVDV